MLGFAAVHCDETLNGNVTPCFSLKTLTLQIQKMQVKPTCMPPPFPPLQSALDH